MHTTLKNYLQRLFDKAESENTTGMQYILSGFILNNIKVT